MKTLTTLNEKIVQRERIDLSEQSSTVIALALFILFGVIGISAGYMILDQQGFSMLFFTASGFFLTGILYLFSLIWKLIGSAYIKGEMLIVKFLFGKYKVTELRTIRGVKSIRILGMQLTSIRFKIDGNHHKVLIFGRTNYIESPKTIIDTIRKVA